jgi:predicted nucleotidyltransferase component of viral defense system
MINRKYIKDRIKIIAKEKQIHFNACWKILLLERFLSRLARSSHANKFIFKGGSLLSYLMKIGRETADLDFLLTRMKAEKKGLQETFGEIISVPSEDGFNFIFDSIDLLRQPHMGYPGYRVTLKTETNDKVQIDIGIGDRVEPLTREILLVQSNGKPLFENTISLLVYPTETIFSEKLETILSKGASNTRLKDYHDLILLLRNKGMLNSEKLKTDITNTFAHRNTIPRLIKFDVISLRRIQQLWAAHLNGLGNSVKKFNLPSEIATAIE